MSTTRISYNSQRPRAWGVSLPFVYPLMRRGDVPPTQSQTLEQVLSSVAGPGRTDLEQGMTGMSPARFVCPVHLRLQSEHLSGGFLLPTDPLISLSGGNVIARRNVSKRTHGGTIKERWSQDDWTVTIQGTLISDQKHTADEYAAMLLLYCVGASVDITCDLLNNYYGIQRIAIETFDFPLTKGVENQQFTIKGYSDDVFDLLTQIQP